MLAGRLTVYRSFRGRFCHEGLKQRIPRRFSILLLALLLALLAAGVALAAGNIDPTDRWAWGTNVGWINFNPAGGDVTVYSDHLEGYAWGENVGWIRLGTCIGGSPCTHANTSSTDYGVNRSGNQLSGYAWGANVGWINFAPNNVGVTIDPVTGWFDGYAWGENIGWIRFRGGTGPTAYGVRLANVTRRRRCRRCRSGACCSWPGWWPGTASGRCVGGQSRCVRGDYAHREVSGVGRGRGPKCRRSLSAAAKAGWWAKAVQLDLEAKGTLVREPAKPLRWHRAS